MAIKSTDKKQASTTQKSQETQKMSLIKETSMYVAAAAACSFMFGTYTISYLTQHSSADPRTVPNFDIDKFGQPWY